MKKKIKDLSKKQIFEAIYRKNQSSVCDDNCQFCIYEKLGFACEIACKKEYETCIDYHKIIEVVGNEEIEVDLNEKED